MKKFIIVIHGWHVSSKGFDIHPVEAPDLEGAEHEARRLKEQRESSFDKCAYAVIEIDDKEHLPRKLTWHERLTGKLQ
jgi:hypothetical protein